MIFLAGLVAIVLGVAAVIRARRAGKRWRPLLAIPIAGAVLCAIGAPRGILIGKAIGLCAMPLGLLWCALFALALALAARMHRRQAALVAAIWIALTIAGNSALAALLMRTVEGEYATMRLHDGPFDAVIVLGGGTGGRAHREVQLGASGDRVMLGARLYREGATPVLVASGSPIRGFMDHDSGRAAERIWRDLDIPAEAIVRVDGAQTTSDEARLHSALIRERGWRRVGLVTSASHMTRARGLFEREGVRVIPLPADVRSEDGAWSGLVSAIPNAPAAAQIHAACWELVGRAAGR